MTVTIASQKGQAVTETILILVLLFSFTLLVSNYFKNNEVLKQLITGPFANLAGMMQNGVWAPPDQGAALHPTGHNRHIVVVSETAQGGGIDDKN